VVGKVAGNRWESRHKIRSKRGHTVQVDRGRGFGRVFEALASSIKTKHELNFIVDSASFQLPQKSSNCLGYPKMPSNFTKNQV